MTTADIKIVLQNALRDVETIDNLLNEYEQTREKKVFAEVTSMMKKVAGQLRELSSNPKCKTKETAPLLQKLGSKMKHLVRRTKEFATSDSGRSSRASTFGSNLPVPLKGWLRKQGQDSIKDWKKRFFRQNNSKVEYFETDEDPDPRIRQITDIVTVGKNLFDIVTSSRTYHLQSEKVLKEDEESVYWIDGINAWREHYKQSGQRRSVSFPDIQEKLEQVKRDQEAEEQGNTPNQDENDKQDGKETNDRQERERKERELRERIEREERDKLQQSRMKSPPTSPAKSNQTSTSIPDLSSPSPLKSTKEESFKVVEIPKESSEDVVLLQKKLEEMTQKNAAKNEAFAQLQQELREKNQLCESLRLKQKAAEEAKQLAEANSEALRKELKEKGEQVEAKDKHIRKLNKRIKQARQEWIAPAPDVPKGSMNSPSSWEMRPDLDSKEREIAQLKDASWAHQTQNAKLAEELARKESEFRSALEVKGEAIEKLEKELNHVKETYNSIREKYLEQQIGLLDPRDQSIIAELQQVKKELFFSLAINCKLNMRSDSNVNLLQLYERALGEDISWRDWPDWISQEVSSSSK